MYYDYFAGAIYTPQQIFMFCAVAFLVAGTVAGLVIFFGRKLANRAARQSKGNPRLSASLLIGFAVVAMAVLLFLVIPTLLKDRSWDSKQQTCAEEVGYSSPAEDNSNVATAESQSAYRRCLGL